MTHGTPSTPSSSLIAAHVRKVLRVHTGEEFEVDDFPSTEDARLAVTELDALLRVVDAAYIAKHEGVFEPLHNALHNLGPRYTRVLDPAETGEARGEGNDPLTGAEHV